jgi:hypothetical protein
MSSRWLFGVHLLVTLFGALAQVLFDQFLEYVCQGVIAVAAPLNHGRKAALQ